jgi:uncharacterized protein (TIGR03083 family)
MLSRIDFASFLEHVRSDGDRLALVAGGHLEADVPPCPGWTVADVVKHVAQVYEHKIACTLTEREPDPWPPAWPPERDPLDWLADAQDRLLSLLSERGPEAHSATWWPSDQTVGFWARRMAHETVIHRVDAELSVGQPSPIDPDLASDGVDEVLNIFLAGDWSGDPEDACQGQRVVVTTGGRAWEVKLDRESVEVTSPQGVPDAEISGDPESVLLWLWGRRSEAGLSQGGDPSLLSLLRARLKMATQ